MTSEIKLRTVYLLKRTDKHDDGTDIYVGSMLRSLRERLWDHRIIIIIIIIIIVIFLQEATITNTWFS